MIVGPNVCYTVPCWRRVKPWAEFPCVNCCPCIKPCRPYPCKPCCRWGYQPWINYGKYGPYDNYYY